MTGRILVVDDDDVILDLLPEILNKYEVLTVNPHKDKDDIISIIESFQPSIVLLDYLGVNGGTICKDIKSKYSTLPVILFSAFGNLQQISKAFRFDGIIEKPFDIDDLGRRINEIVSRRDDSIVARGDKNRTMG